MKRIIALFFVALIAMSCTSETKFGKCVGINDDKDPSLLYKMSEGNVVVGLLLL